jgi:uncharacterized membrane protein (DUF4010 family)
MAIQAAGHVAVRAAGVRFGFAISGLVAGLISSTGTIAALGARARSNPRERSACVSGALFSTVATMLLLVVVVISVHPPALVRLATSLVCATAAIMAAAGLALWTQRGHPAPVSTRGRAFSLLYAAGFASLLAGMTGIVGLVQSRLGSSAASAATALAGIVDVHAATASALSRAASGSMGLNAVAEAILLAFSANTASKLVAAFGAGGPAYGMPVSAGLLLAVAAAWVPEWLMH